VVAWGGKKTAVVSGTSFSAPLIAGLAACIWQFYGDTLKSSLLKKLLIQSGCWWPYYDYRLGFGIPAIENLLSIHDSNIDWEIFTDNTHLYIHFSAPLANNEKLYYKIEKQLGEFELYGFVEIKKGISKANISWERLCNTDKKGLRNMKIYTGKTLWLKWRNQQKEIKIP
jgi:subtilase family serine protease